MSDFSDALHAIDQTLLGMESLYALLAVGTGLAAWTAAGPLRSLTQGVQLLLRRRPAVGERAAGAMSPGAALAVALAGSAGLGSISAVALAISLGGPGAVFWMWVAGLAAMALKAVEATLVTLYRDVTDPERPHGGPMWVASRGLGSLPFIGARLGGFIGVLFALPLLMFAVTDGNMLQAYSTAEIFGEALEVRHWVTGAVLAALVGAVLSGGTQRIGQVAGVLMPAAIVAYVICGSWLLLSHSDRIPAALQAIWHGAFAPTDASGAFTGAAAGTAFLFGVRRTLYAAQSGFGTTAIAHAASRTSEPAAQGLIAGLEPFIGTFVLSSVTALSILVTGVWNRAPAAQWDHPPPIVESEPGRWAPADTSLPSRGETTFVSGQPVYTVVEINGEHRKLRGTIELQDAGLGVRWQALRSVATPSLTTPGIFVDYGGAAMIARAFDAAAGGVGRWIAAIAVGVFALATLLAWAHFAEQGLVYLLGTRAVAPLRVLWCALIMGTCVGPLHGDEHIVLVGNVALGLLLVIQLPMVLLLTPKAMRAWHDYLRRQRHGKPALRVKRS